MAKTKIKISKKERENKIREQNRERSKRLNERRDALAKILGFENWSNMMTRLGKFLSENSESPDAKNIIEIFRRNVV